MSRDPNEPKVVDSNRKPIDPKKLHKYLYAGGDPVNRKDPTGKVYEYILENAELGGADQLALEFGETEVNKILECVADMLALYPWSEEEAWEVCLE